MKKQRTSQNAWVLQYKSQVITSVALIALALSGWALHYAHNSTSSDESTQVEEAVMAQVSNALTDQVITTGETVIQQTLEILESETKLDRLSNGISVVDLPALDLPEDAELVVFNSKTDVKYYIGSPWDLANLKPIYGCEMTLTGINPTTKKQREIASFEIRSDLRDEDGWSYQYSVMNRGVYTNHREWFSNDFSKMAVTRTYYPDDNDGASDLPSSRVGWLTSDGGFCDVTDYLDITYDEDYEILGALGFVKAHLVYGNGFNEEVETFCVLGRRNEETRVYVAPLTDLMEAMKYEYVLNTKDPFNRRTYKSVVMQAFLNGLENIHPTSEFMTSSEDFILLADIDNISNLLQLHDEESFMTSKWGMETEDFCGWNGVIDASGNFVAFMVADSDAFYECLAETEGAEKDAEDNNDDNIEHSEADGSQRNEGEDSDSSESSETSPTEILIVNAEKSYATKVNLGIELSPPHTDWKYASNFCTICGWISPSNEVAYLPLD